MSLGFNTLALKTICRNFLEDTMKSIALAAALSLAATTAFAGSYEAPTMEMEPEMIAESTSSSAGGIIVPLLALVVLYAALS